MDTSSQDTFITDRHSGLEKLGRQQESDDDGDNMEETDGSDEDGDNDSVSVKKCVGNKEKRVNGVKSRAHISSDESSDDDDDGVDIATVAPAKVALVTSCILTNAS